VCPVEKALLENVTSSRTRLRILSLMSQRPRTLRELAKLTDISVQGVLRHLKALDEMGLVQERTISSKEFPTRKLYSVKGVRVDDFSVEDLMVVKASKRSPVGSAQELPAEGFEKLAGEILLDRRRIKDKAKRLARMIEGLAESETRLMKAIADLKLADDERLVLQTVFTEETLQEAEEILSRVQGLQNARRSIDKALAKARRIGSR